MRRSVTRHLRLSVAGVVVAACGAHGEDEVVTKDRSRVTCSACLRSAREAGR